MKKLLSLLFLAIVIFLSGCQEDKITCNIKYPYNNQSVLVSKDLVITVEATSTKSTVEKVTVTFSNIISSSVDVLKFELVTEPFTVTIPSQALVIGHYMIHATATSSEGKEAESSVIVKIVESIDYNEKESPDFVTFTNGKFPDGWVTYTWESANIGYDDNYSIRSVNYPIATVYTKKTMNAPYYVEFYTKGGDVDFYIDDVKAKAIIFEEGNWNRWIYPVDSGKHAFRWQAEGINRYLDAIRFTTTP
jgi:hypothetical protein